MGTQSEIEGYEDATEELKDAIKRLREQALRDARGEKEAIEEQRRQHQYKQEIKHEEANPICDILHFPSFSGDLALALLGKEKARAQHVIPGRVATKERELRIC